MNEYTNAGVDVHAGSVSCKALRPETGECWSKTFSGEGCEHELLAWLKNLPGPVRCAYEFGCTGFLMSRFLESGCVECEVMAVSTISRQTSRKKYLRPGHEVSTQIEEIAVEANERLRKRYAGLKDAKKHANVAKVAVVSEMARWMWAIGLQVQCELADAS